VNKRRVRYSLCPQKLIVLVIHNSQRQRYRGGDYAFFLSTILRHVGTIELRDGRNKEREEV
jgi:hypothetical protein